MVRGIFPPRVTGASWRKVSFNLEESRLLSRGLGASAEEQKTQTHTVCIKSEASEHELHGSMRLCAVTVSPCSRSAAVWESRTERLIEFTPQTGAPGRTFHFRSCPLRPTACCQRGGRCEFSYRYNLCSSCYLPLSSPTKDREVCAVYGKPSDDNAPSQIFQLELDEGHKQEPRPSHTGTVLHFVCFFFRCPFVEMKD